MGEDPCEHTTLVGKGDAGNPALSPWLLTTSSKTNGAQTLETNHIQSAGSWTNSPVCSKFHIPSWVSDDSSVKDYSQAGAVPSQHWERAPLIWGSCTLSTLTGAKPGRSCQKCPLHTAWNHRSISLQLPHHLALTPASVCLPQDWRAQQDLLQVVSHPPRAKQVHAFPSSTEL